MLTCIAICRSRDKKPGGNKVDAALASSVSIAETSFAEEKYPDDLVISMTKNRDNPDETLEKEILTMNSVFSGIGMTPEKYESLCRQAKLAMDLYGEP